MNKTSLHQTCVDIVQTRVDDVLNAMKSVQESIEGEDKSSAGDKFETARAMAHNEMEQLSEQLRLLKNDFNLLQQLNPSVVTISVQVGSLVQTNKRWLYIAVGLGKVVLGDEFAFAISPASPLAQVFIQKAAGEKVTFNGQQEEILELR